MIFTSQDIEGPIPNVTLYDYLFSENNNFKDEQYAYIDSKDPSQAITFGDLKSLILKLGVGLKRNYPDFKQGDVIAIYSPNNIYYPPTVHGIVVAGGSVATVDHTCDAKTVASCLSTVQAKLIIAHPDTLVRAQEAAKIAGIPTENILVYGESTYNVLWNHEELITPVKYTEKKLKEHPCYFYFTSGTTGKKKAVVVTQRMIIACMDSRVISIPEKLKLICHTELHHSSAMVGALHLCIKLGYTTYLMKEFNFDDFFYSIQAYKGNFISIQPWIIAYMVKEKSITSRYDLSSLRTTTSSGSFASKELCKSFYEIFKIPVINMFGMTEVLGSFYTNLERTLEGSVGSLAAGFEAKILDNDGNHLGYNKIGELCIKGPTVTSGYYNNSESTSKAFDSDGFLHTGDLFRVSDEGYFTHVDRTQNIIKYKYKKIIPQDLENILKSHPSVIECSVVGVYNEEAACMVPRAFVSVMNDIQDTEKIRTEILGIAETQLSDYQQIRGGLFIIDKLPRNSSGKTDRAILRQYEVKV